ncbi:hypothetical protein BZARG_1019 [Bizionia argentinensis JUB59]|uniref:Secreted protein n=1 Tax=Bizionia argentinensis JUB59 TaxID=1046627 RepID=G2EEB9_9FLAO|nr:hypothetical protein [Bizionia argentinensis]EGV43185.1 hypothetical protein BZARG_1019 [Bizionia argentinensis JUB59]
MSKIYAVILLILTPTLAMSQGLVFNSGNSINKSTGLVEIDPAVLNESHTGSPYITEELSDITLSKIEGKTFKARYNAAHDVMEVVGEDGKHYNLVRDPELEVTFIRSGQNYRVFNLGNESNDNGFFVVLNDGDIKLLKKEIIKFYDEEFSTTGYDKAKPAKFKREKDEFYFMKDGVLSTEIPRNKKSFISLLNIDSNKENKILSYIKKNRLKLNDEQDLITLFTYININKF